MRRRRRRVITMQIDSRCGGGRKWQSGGDGGAAWPAGARHLIECRFAAPSPRRPPAIASRPRQPDSSNEIIRALTRARARAQRLFGPSLINRASSPLAHARRLLLFFLSFLFLFLACSACWVDRWIRVFDLVDFLGDWEGCIVGCQVIAGWMQNCFIERLIRTRTLGLR